MAIAFRGSNAGTAANGGDVSLALTSLLDANLPPNTVSAQDGDFVVVVYGVGSASDRAMSVSGTFSADLTEQFESYSNGSGSDANLAVYTGFWNTGDGTGITCTGSGDAADSTVAAVFAFSGVDPTTPLDVAIQTTTGTGATNPNPPSITPTTTGAWIMVGGAGAGSNTALTNPGDLSSTNSHFRNPSVSDTNAAALAVGLKTNWTSGAFDGSAMTGGATAAGHSWASFALAIRPYVVNHYSMTADGGSYALTGTAANTLRGYPMAADGGSYSLTGTAASLEADRALAADGGSYALTGTAASLLRGMGLLADTGSYLLTGSAADLIIGLLNHYTLTAEAGSYILNGTAAAFRKFSPNDWAFQAFGNTTFTALSDPARFGATTDPGRFIASRPPNSSEAN